MFDRDKKLHFFFGLFFATTATVITNDNIDNLLKASITGFIVALIIGTLKELFDKYLSEWFAKMLPRFFNKSQWSWGDILADVIGGVGGIILGLIIILVYR